MELRLEQIPLQRLEQRQKWGGAETRSEIGAEFGAEIGAEIGAETVAAIGAGRRRAGEESLRGGELERSR